jgi:nitrate/nitrite transporter NarK
MGGVTEQIHDIGRRRAWVIWLVGLSVYVLAIFNRSSLGVAGLVATQRFGISATQLSFFTVLQLVVYAGLQVPIGILLDRFGSRRLLLAGLVLMSIGQLIFAFAQSFVVAVGARALIGAGDATVFVSVIRLVTVWFLVRQAPLVTQLTGQLGQMGAVVAAAPLSWALTHLGWTKAFAIASVLGTGGMAAVALLVKDSPYARESVARTKFRALARTLRLVWGNPGTRLGMWSHFTSQFSGTVFTLLWGFPFLVSAELLTPGQASALLMVMTAWIIASGLVLGAMVSRFPFYRSWMVLGIVVAMALWWGVVLARSTPAPMWMLVVLVCLMAMGGPASMVGFDMARTFIPVEATGRANGFVNIGGFSASLLTMGLIGVLLDWHSRGVGTTEYDLGDFRVAMSVQYVFWVVGAIQILRYRHKAIHHLHRVHPGVVEQMKRGEAFAHLGFHEREGV